MNLSKKELRKLPKDIPTIIKGYFDCSYNQLVTLEGGPEKVGRSFYCYNNQLTTLEGSPKKVGGGFNCQKNQLVTLKGGPEKVGGDFYCYNNPNLPLLEIIKFIFRCDIEESIYSDYDDDLLNEINENKDDKHKVIGLIFK